MNWFRLAAYPNWDFSRYNFSHWPIMISEVLKLKPHPRVGAFTHAGSDMLFGNDNGKWWYWQNKDVSYIIAVSVKSEQGRYNVSVVAQKEGGKKKETTFYGPNWQDIPYRTVQVAYSLIDELGFDNDGGQESPSPVSPVDSLVNV